MVVNPHIIIILTDNFVLSLRQVVAHHSTYVSAQTVPDTVYAISGSAQVREVCVQLGGTLAHQPRVSQRRQVTRVSGQRAPVHHEHVKVSAHQVGCSGYRTYTHIR